MDKTFYFDRAGIFRVNAGDSGEGRGYAQLDWTLLELNIESLCANMSQTQGLRFTMHLMGRVE
ncbi:hypothetical protein [Cupriavidus sp. CuC1]|uniref:hypothetical protein n=1 Tax=Cupriavidus sp. CuC1 TaxID=3373131 RepID=UPI0037D8DD8F